MSGSQDAADAVEQHLRRRIAELQEYRRVGVTTAFEAEAYDQQKATRVRPCEILLTQAGYRPLLPRDRPEPVVSGARVNAGQHRFLHGIAGTPPPPGAKIGHEPIARPSQSNRRIGMSPHSCPLTQPPRSISPMPPRSTSYPSMNRRCARNYASCPSHTSASRTSISGKTSVGAGDSSGEMQGESAMERATDAQENAQY